MGEHIYILNMGEGKEDLVFISENKLLTPDVMVLMMEHKAEYCKIYKTNGHDDMEHWEVVSILCNTVGCGIFA